LVQEATVTPTAADNLLLLAGALAGGGMVALVWIWSTDPVNRDGRYATALLVVIVIIIAYFVRFLP
jgi:hypothetical protein